MKYTVRRAQDDLEAYPLHLLTFPHDDWEDEDRGNVYWIAHDESGTPVAFASARPLKGEPGVFLSRCGVLPCAQGQGLQRRLIKARAQWARREGHDYALTYTVHGNHASLMNLLRCGFRLYHPSHRYAGDVDYLWRAL